MTDAAKRTAVLHLVRQVLTCGAVSSNGAEGTLPEKYEDLQSGVFMYRILAHIAPQMFFDADSICGQTAAGHKNWVMRKGNLITLLQHMNDYVHTFLEAPNTLDLTLLISAADIANSPALSSDLQEPEVQDKGMEHLMELTDIFVVILVFSGDSALLTAVKSLSYADQVVLSNAAKACITKHALRPRRRGEPSTLGDTRVASAHRSAESSRGGDFFVRGAPQHLSSSVNEGIHHQYRLLQLRRELDDANSRVVELESKLQFALDEKQEWESKYKKILGELEQQRASFAAEDHLRQLLAKKEATLRSLTAAAEEHAKKIEAFREATTAQETALGIMKRKLTQTEGELMKQNVERREALEKLRVAEEQLTVQMNARKDQEQEMEDMRAELALMKVQTDKTDDNDFCLKRSFSSIASVDRVVQLENELDEVRSQKQAAERLLQVFQRQLALLPSGGVRPSAAADALKAQLRHAEMEKEELRQQLAATIARLEAADGQWGGRSSHGAVEEGTESLTTGEKIDGADVNGVLARDSVNSNEGKANVREGRDEFRREQIVLASTLLLLGYRNLMLQQRAMLANRSNGGFVGTLSETVDERKNEEGTYTGSFLTRHRHEIEEGLMESVLGRGGWRH